MAKQLNRPQEIRARANIEGVPLSFTRNGRPENVTAIYERWRVADEWWGKEIKRDYFRIKTGTGLVCDIYHDTAADRWYLSKIHD